jgi:Kinesin motor domain
MEEPVKVYIRVRPPSENELISRDFKRSVDCPDRQRLNLSYPRDTIRPFHFDGVLNEQATESEVYELTAKGLVNYVLQGYNGTFFVYGQTGTGKTHTMGLLKKISPKAEGIIPSVLKDIFDKEESPSVTLSFLQIYMENVYDLLKPDKKPLQVREDPNGGIFVKDLTQVPIENYSQAANLINAGLCNRIMGSHNANLTSSRSHIVLALEIEQKHCTSRMTLIDLAGSERVGSTSSSGLRLDEAKFINSSLSALGKVVSALSSDSSAHIPYRDSKLTRLLQPFLNGKVVLVATVGTSYKFGGETLSTLQFASRCKQFVCLPALNEEDSLVNFDDKTVQELRRREEFLSARVKELETQNSMIFNHSHAEVVYYLVRLLSKLTQNSIKLTQEVHKTRQDLSVFEIKQAEEKFPYPLNNYKTEEDDVYMQDLFLKLDVLPSSQVVEKVQFLAKKLVDNMNVLGKLAVQGQLLKTSFNAKAPSEVALESMKREASEAVLQTKFQNNSGFQSRPQVIKITEGKETTDKLQKNLSLKELLRSKKSAASFETVEKSIITEIDPLYECSLTERELKQSKIDVKRNNTRSPLPQRRVTVTDRKLSKDSSTELTKEKSETLSRVATKLQIARNEKNSSKTPSPFFRKPDKTARPSKPSETRYTAPKDDFLAELEKEFASIDY